MTKRKSIDSLLRELKFASDECWQAKLATNDVAKRHAPLCAQIVEVLGVPALINQRLALRTKETDGRPVTSADFWENEDMIIALYEHYLDAIEFVKEGADGST